MTIFCLWLNKMEQTGDAKAKQEAAMNSVAHQAINKNTIMVLSQVNAKLDQERRKYKQKKKDARLKTLLIAVMTEFQQPTYKKILQNGFNKWRFKHLKVQRYEQ